MTQTETSPRPSDQRVVRVFVSSTFLDMQADRDELSNWVFPRLRKLCESRGVTWGEVDLRWGITDEQKAEGRVLPICLAEIRQCRPYFLGLLGERYGWVPEEIDPALLEQESWLAAERGKSVTELEILHGVLNDPAMADHAFFYLRSPRFATTPDLRENPTPEEVAEYGAEEAERRADERRGKLQKLKNRIKTSSLPVREDYPDPKALGELVFQDLSAVIDRLYPAGSEPEPLDREAAEHEAFAASRAAVYIGCDEYLQALDAHADGDGPPLVVLGESGSGKSALLANWALDYRATHPDELVVLHFTGASPASAYWAGMLARILGELQRRLELELETPAHPEALRAVFAGALHMAAGKTRLVLVLDGLDQLEDRDGAPDLVWLPPEIPSNVRLVVSTLEGRPLDELRRRGWPSLSVERLSAPEREQLVVQYLAQYDKALSEGRVRHIADGEQTGNPLFLRALLEELRLWGDHLTLDERIDHYLAAANVTDLYDRILERYEQVYERDVDALVRDSMSLLWAGRRGLSEAELLDLLGSDEKPLPSAHWSPLYLAAEQSLVSRQGLIGFAHEYFRAAVEDRYLSTPAEKQAVHERVASYFEGRDLTSRKVEELPWQLAQAQAWPRLAALLSNLDFLSAAWDVDQFEVKAFWSAVERNSSVRMVDAYRSVLDQLDEHPPESLWRLGRLLGEVGYPDDAAPVWEHLADHSRRIGDVENLIPTLGEQALAFISRWETDAALPLLEEQERLCRQIGDLQRLQVALGNRSIVHLRRGDLEAALDSVEEQEQICRQLDDVQGLQIALGHRANVLLAQEKPDEALPLLQEKERLCRLLGNMEGLQISLNGQARILSGRGDADGALALYQQQEQACRELSLKQGLCEALGGQGAILIARGELDRAMALHKEEEALARELGFKDGLQRSLGNQAAILEARGDDDAALELFDQQEKLCRELNHEAGLQGCLGNQAVIRKRRGELDQALALLEEQERICRSLGDKTGLLRSLNAQGDILQARGDVDAALERLQEHEQLCGEVGDAEGLAVSLNNQAVIVYGRGDVDGALPLFEAHSQLARELGDKRTLQRLLMTQASILQVRGDLDPALPLLQEHAELCRELVDMQELQRSLGNQSQIVLSHGNVNGALALLEEQEGLCRELGNVEALERCLANQAVIGQARAELDALLAPFKEQERLCEAAGDLEGLRGALMSQIGVLTERGVFEETLAPLEAAARVSRDLGDPVGMAVTLATRASALARLGRSSEAGLVAEEALPVLEEYGLPELAWQVRSFLGYADAEPGRMPAATAAEAPWESAGLDPRAERRRLAELSMHYQDQLAYWESLPWWRRRIVKRPEPPAAI